jgi:Fe-S-cluster containining protein
VENCLKPLSKKDTFSFACHQKIDCYNHCCKDLIQYLTPYDILRLKNRLDLTSGDFLKRYTSEHTGLESGLPVVTLKATTRSELKCPFVTAKGCRVYEDRPSSCRLYPLARGLTRSRETGELKEAYLLIRESHCFGFNEGQTISIREWIDQQGISEYNEQNDRLMNLIGLKNQYMPGPMDEHAKNIFRLALYDLDRFRTYTIENHLFSSRTDGCPADDVTLLKFGIQWVRQQLFRDLSYETSWCLFSD